MATTQLSIKLLIDAKTEKLCFAEAGSDVVDFISGLLSLPLGTVANLLTKERMDGSIVNVVGSMDRLDANYKSKEGRLSPAVVPATLSCLQELLSPDLSNGNNNIMQLFTCEGPRTANTSYYHTSSYKTADRRVSCGYLSTTINAACPYCQNSMNKVMTLADAVIHGPMVTAAAPRSYAIKDDLSVTPVANVLSGITLLAQCGVTEFSTVQEKNVKIGKQEALAILAASLKSKTVLTDVFLPKKNARCKREPPEDQ